MLEQFGTVAEVWGMPIEGNQAATELILRIFGVACF
jgi:hypothetical protein